VVEREDRIRISFDASLHYISRELLTKYNNTPGYDVFGCRISGVEGARGLRAWPGYQNFIIHIKVRTNAS